MRISTCFAPAAVAAAALLLGCSSREFVPGADVFNGGFDDGGSNASLNSVQHLTSIAVGPEGEIALTGSFSGVLDFRQGELKSSGDNDVFVAVLEPDGAPRWSGHTGSNFSEQRGQAVAVAPNGDVVLAGNFTETVSFGGAPLATSSQAAFLVRFNEAGEMIWNKQLGKDNSSVAVGGLALAPDGGIVIGGSFSGAVDLGGSTLSSGAQTSFVAKFDAAGKPVFSLGFGGINNQVTAVAVDAEGAVFAAGINSGSLDLGKPFSTEGQSVFVAKLDPRGKPVWSAQLNNGGMAKATSIAVSPGGDVVVAGNHAATLSFGDEVFTPTSGQNGFVAELSSRGDPRWLKSFGSTTADLHGNSVTINAVAVGAEGHVLLTGGYADPTDFGGGPLPQGYGGTNSFFAELDAGGAHVKSQGPADLPQIASGDVIAVDPAGGVIYGGNSNSSAGIFLMRQER